MTRALGLWGPCVAYMAAIFFTSAQSHVTFPLGVPDKVFHVLGYTGLGMLFIRALAGGLPTRLTTVTALAGLLLTVAYGVSDEFHQTFVPGRSADVEDLLADTIGGAGAVVVCWLWGIISAGPAPDRGTSRHDL